MSLVAILDAAKGFLGAERPDPDDWPGSASRGGRGAARRRQSHRLDGEGDQRNERRIQQAYNEKHGIVPTAAGKKASNSILSFLELSRKLKTDGPDADLVQVAGKAVEALEDDADGMALDALPELIDQLELKMKDAAKKLDFEEAANLRDRIKQLRQKLVGKV